MWRSIFEYKPLAWFFKLMREIPISPDDSPRQLLAALKEARRALEAGERVGLFAEGAITRCSQLRGFRNGMEYIARDLDIVIIPTHIDRMWGSIFSFERGKFIWKKPRLSRLPLTISFGKPLPSSTLTHAVRQAVSELGCDAFEHRLERERPLHEAFLRQAKKKWFAPCLVDATGKTLLSYGQLAARAALLGRRLKRSFRGETPVGVLFAASPSASLSTLALLFAGKIPVPLNPALSKEKLAALCAASGVRQILTSRETHGKFNFSLVPHAIYLDEIRVGSTLKRFVVTFGIRFLPRWFEKRHDTAAVLFTRAVDAKPVPVQVPHSTITASLLGLQDVLALKPEDTVTSGMPASDSLAFTTALWWPLLHGARIKHTGDNVLVEDRFALTREESEESTEAAQQTGVPLLSAYTRAGLAVVCVSALDVREGNENQKGGKGGTVGRPVPGVCVRIVDPYSGALLPPGTMGLLHVKSVTLSKLADVPLTHDGWFNTGDSAACDEEGFITFPRIVRG
jgi:acyl-[acyl-carrier-protein]-phospholipid O-acyltransferase/long-chain-fatty-acid--[acyl-carrier-protein] ligase